MEERIGRLEVNVEHIKTDVADMKVDIRRLSDKVGGVDQKLNDKIDAVEQKLTDKFDGLKDAVTALPLSFEKGRVLDRVWFLLMSAGIFGIMARAFKWI